MKNFSSFIVSIFIHSIILLLFFFSYTTIQKILEQHKKKETTLCIKLNNCIVTPKNTSLQKSSLIKEPIKKIKNKKVQKKTFTKKKKLKKTTKHILPTPKPKPKKITKTPKKTVKKQSLKTTVKKQRRKTDHKESLHVNSLLQQKKIKEKQQEQSYKQIYIDKNLHKIRELIKENLYYPRKARRRHIEGKVILKVTISKQGTIKNIDIISSDHTILTHAAKQIFILIEDQIPKPKKEITLTVPISYKLH